MKYMTAFRKFFSDLWHSLSPFTRAAFVRAGKTMAQVALARLATGDRLTGVNWPDMIDLVGMAGMLSILTSAAAGLPEATLRLEAVPQDGKDGESDDNI